MRAMALAVCILAIVHAKAGSGSSGYGSCYGDERQFIPVPKSTHKDNYFCVPLELECYATNGNHRLIESFEIDTMNSPGIELHMR